jgi:hypothetical protein
MSLFCLGEVDFIEKRLVSDMNSGEQQCVSGEKEQGQNGDMGLCLRALNHRRFFSAGIIREFYYLKRCLNMERSVGFRVAMLLLFGVHRPVITGIHGVGTAIL